MRIETAPTHITSGGLIFSIKFPGRVLRGAFLCLSEVFPSYTVNAFQIPNVFNLQSPSVLQAMSMYGLFRIFLQLSASVRGRKLRQRRDWLFCGSSRELPHYPTRSHQYINFECLSGRKFHAPLIGIHRTTCQTKLIYFVTHGVSLLSPSDIPLTNDGCKLSVEARVIQKITNDELSV